MLEHHQCPISLHAPCIPTSAKRQGAMLPTGSRDEALLLTLEKVVVKECTRSTPLLYDLVPYSSHWYGV